MFWLLVSRPYESLVQWLMRKLQFWHCCLPLGSARLLRELVRAPTFLAARGLQTWGGQYLQLSRGVLPYLKERQLMFPRWVAIVAERMSGSSNLTWPPGK